MLALLGALSACYAPTVNRQRSYHPSDADVTITRIVHASFIVDFGTTRVLVDPWFSPAPPLGQRETIGIALDRIPEVRGILITHRHNDHFDRETLESYRHKSVRVITVRGLGEDLREMGYTDVVEIGEWEQSQIGGAVVRAVPARHSVDETGYVLQANGVTTYLAGDSLFDEESFRAIAQEFPAIDVAVLPVGGIRIFGRRLDMNPNEAAAAVKILKPSRVIPSHYGLTGPFPFVFSSSEPASEFSKLVQAKVPATQVIVLQPGESWHYYR